MTEESDGPPDASTWACRNCGIQYNDRPSVCPDCMGEAFDPVERPDEPSAPRDEATDHSTELDQPSSGGRVAPRWIYAAGILLVLGGAVFLFAGGPGLLAPNPCADVPERVGDSSQYNRSYVECSFHDSMMAIRSEEGASDLRFSPELQSHARELASRIQSNGWSSAEARRQLGNSTTFRPCDTDGDGQVNYVIFQAGYYQTQSVSDSGESTSYGTNDELVGGLTDALRADEQSVEAVSRGGYQKHGVGTHYSGDRVVVVQLYC